MRIVIIILCLFLVSCISKNGVVIEQDKKQWSYVTGKWLVKTNVWVYKYGKLQTLELQEYAFVSPDDVEKTLASQLKKAKELEKKLTPLL